MAIALFPLNEGETLGSNFGRYAEFIGVRPTVRLRQRLFGYACLPGTRLPSAVSHLAEQTRHYWNMEAETIVKDHTEFRYATMMASPSMRERIFREMLDPPSSLCVQKKFRGLQGEHVSRLRYCGECLATWRDKMVTPYWRLDHQLPGAYCCFAHSSVLKVVRQTDTEALLDSTLGSLRHPCDEAILGEASSSEKNAIEDVAKRSAQQRMTGANSPLAQRYRDLLWNAGFVRPDTRVKHETLVSAWLAYFGPEYCFLTGMGPRKISMWVSKISEYAPARDVPNPFMFIAAESFFEHLNASPGSFVPGNRSDAKMLKTSTSSSEWEMVAPNFVPPSCDGVLHRDIDTLRLSGRLKKSGGWKLVCSCGISYRLLDESQSGSISLTPFAYGARYRSRFRALMAKGASIATAGHKLNISKSNALTWARKEGYANVETLSPVQIRKLRSVWCRLVEKSKSESRISKAHRADPTVYKALHLNDRQWLLRYNREHRSWHLGTTYNVKRTDATRNRIREGWRALMRTEPPVRARRGSILGKAGLPRHLGDLTKYRTLLAGLSETRQAYLERVISWLAGMAATQRLHNCNEAIRLAGLNRRSFGKEQWIRIRKFQSVAGVDK
jgi:Tn7-like transposition protein D/TniQ